jgi:predicted ribosomally synthesized peptide with SipW-like signal peptide
MHQTLSLPGVAGEPTTTSEPRRHRRRGVLALLLGLSVVSLGAGAMSLALFTDSAASSGTFASGTIDISSSPAVAFSVSAMVPGDSQTAALTLANNGTAALRYTLGTVATNTLGDALDLTVKTQGTSCAAFDGTTVLAATALDGAAFGDPAQGAQAGDRSLAAGASEVLCFRVSLSLATGNAMQAQGSNATFTFDAEQTANNP